MSRKLLDGVTKVTVIARDPDNDKLTEKLTEMTADSFENLIKTPSRPQFRLSGTADVKHLNVRKESPDDEKVLAVDLKLEFKQIDSRLCDYFDDALQAFLWRGYTDGMIVRNTCLAPVAYTNTVKGSVKIGTHRFTGCEIQKFAITPQDGGVMTLVCSASIYPSASDMPDLSRVVQDQERVEIEADPDLFDGAQK